MATQLHSSDVDNGTQRTTARQRVAMAARLTWRDPNGVTRFASVVTRDVSESGVFVECGSATPLPQFRLVHVELEGPGVPGTPLAGGRVLAAVWRVERSASGHGSPQGYGLRFMVAPAAPAAAAFRRADLAAAC